jgi:hypothetical protein
MGYNPDTIISMRLIKFYSVLLYQPQALVRHYQHGHIDIVLFTVAAVLVSRAAFEF